MTHKVAQWDSVDVDIPIQFGRVQFAQGSWRHPIDQHSTLPCHHLEMSLVDDAIAQGCFVDHWDNEHFETCGHLFFIPADQQVHFKSQVKNQRSIICEFHRESLEALSGEKIQWDPSSLSQLLDLKNRSIRKLFTRIYAEVTNPGEASKQMLDALTTQMAIELIRHIKSRSQKNDHKEVLSSWRLRKIDKRLADISSTASLEELADICCLSVRHLCRLFQATHHQSLGSYVAETRAEHARKMIASGVNIKAVSYALGFSAPSNFSRAFSRTTGETPKQYQQRIQAIAATNSFHPH